LKAATLHELRQLWSWLSSLLKCRRIAHYEQDFPAHGTQTSAQLKFSSMTSARIFVSSVFQTSALWLRRQPR
jgi:hypothetical protein